MTDYGELMARAVAALDKSTGAYRRALYERMRTALVEALRKVDPPLSESEITQERLSLENAIRKVEAEAVHRAWVEASDASTLAKVEAAEQAVPDQESAPPDGDRARREETGETVSPRPAQSRQLFARAAVRAVDLDRFERPLESPELKRKSESLPRMSESEPRIAPRLAAPQPLAARRRPPAAAAAEPPGRSKGG